MFREWANKVSGESRPHEQGESRTSMNKNWEAEEGKAGTGARVPRVIGKLILENTRKVLLYSKSMLCTSRILKVEFCWILKNMYVYFFERFWQFLIGWERLGSGTTSTSGQSESASVSSRGRPSKHRAKSSHSKTPKKATQNSTSLSGRQI